MTLALARTNGHSLRAAFARLGDLVAKGLARAERSNHRRLGCAFVSPEVLRAIQLGCHGADTAPLTAPAGLPGTIAQAPR